MSEAIESMIQRGLTAVENDDIEAAKSVLAQAVQTVGENHNAVLHLQGMMAWREGDFDRASGYLMQAVDGDPENPAVYLDCAELLLVGGQDIDEAEAILRILMGREKLDQDIHDQARLFLARARLEHDDPDPEEALELLNEIKSPLHESPYALSTRAEALLELGRHQEAITDLDTALASSPEDGDLHYQLGITQKMAGEDSQAIKSLLRVLEIDAAEASSDEIDYSETQELRTQLEEVLEDLPEMLLRRIANAPITVQTRPTPDQVRQGADPRGSIIFEGQSTENENDASANDTEEQEPELERIIIMRDVLANEISSDEELVDELMLGVLDELRRFFQIDNLQLATV